MRALVIVTLFAVGCASTPEADTVDRAVYEGYTVEQVREAAWSVVTEVTHQSKIRVHDRRVVTEGRLGRCGEHVRCASYHVYGAIEPSRTTLDLRLHDRGTATAVEVTIEYETESHCRDEQFERDPGCLPQSLSSTGGLEREILDRIRARLEGGGEDGVAAGLSARGNPR